MSESRPPSFLRRHLAANADGDLLVGLACDENIWVRKQAAQNPATPRWVIDLLVRSGADRDLRGRHDPDPDMPAAELRRLVECGPWAQQLVADHPNATGEILDALVRHPSHRIRRSVAVHANTPATVLAGLCADANAEIRRRAAVHQRCPEGVLAVMWRAGADPELAGVGTADADSLDADELATLGDLGPWGRFLAGRHAACPPDLLDRVATDPDWRIRSAVLDNPAAPAAMRSAAAGLDDSVAADGGGLDQLADRAAAGECLASMAEHPSAEVRLAVGRHPSATAEAIGVLALDRVADVRRLAAGHRLMDRDALSLLVRAGSSADLAGLAEPDDSVTPAELDELSRSGYWARQLAVRHPDTTPETLGRLLCDDDPKLREWAAARPAVPAGVVDLLRRAGAAQDFQGIAEGDPDMPVDDLLRVEALGPYAVTVASWHPNAPERLRLLRDPVPDPG